MKFQKLITLFVASVLLSFGFMTAQQLLAQQKQPAEPKGEMKSMEHMPMDQMMKDCMQHHQSVTKSIDETSKTIEGAKQSNDPAKMRAALDQAQKQLTEMKEHMSMCSNMMGMMEKMQGMGEMKGSSK